MSQEAFIRDILKTWEMSECRHVLTPGEAGSTLALPCEGTPDELDPEDVLRAQKLVGSLIWLSVRTRPDICYAQSRISSMATKAPRQAMLEGLRVCGIYRGPKRLVCISKHVRTMNKLLRTLTQISLNRDLRLVQLLS